MSPRWSPPSQAPCLAQLHGTNIAKHKTPNALLTSSAVTAPLDTIKIRFQLLLLHDKEASGAEIVKSLLRKEGVSALWKGNVPAECLYILYGGSQFTSFSILNKSLTTLEQDWGIKLGQSTHLLVVGGGAGFVSTLFTYPFDLLRTHLAANRSELFLSLRLSCKRIYAERGLFGFYAGLRPSLASIVASSGIFFWAYSLARATAEEIKKSAHRDIWGVEAVCGFTAGATAKAITFPLDTVRKRMQVSHDHRALRLFLRHWREKGFLNFYRGFTISLMKTAPTSAVSMTVYEYAITFTRKITSRFQA